eukprot:484197-Pelagomonas_calceolata.AAC.10
MCIFKKLRCHRKHKIYIIPNTHEKRGGCIIFVRKIVRTSHSAHNSLLTGLHSRHHSRHHPTTQTAGST